MKQVFQPLLKARGNYSKSLQKKLGNAVGPDIVLVSVEAMVAALNMIA